ncbi:ATP-binding cassette subfamily C protein CydC [Herbihabitans rhizosphaerae]|uniref:ATP-binding cassette subfamily C protein CydC n=1 Tax=Herbihabitans rhizosphaerae TaxID=1872711 RepID=A0A4Q7L523_9PSEU|nr:ATP-binding cassette domain-containing protein [Herbihabitans rhizosphaerae]RZS44316.1 ATP-binding cassette subfamily C protein CydC [Herbihabitans rhizosphaerae]
MSPLWTVFGARRAALLGAGLTSAAAELAGVTLTATAAWLIARAAEMPPIGALTVAIVAVRTLAIGRGGLRYAERLAGHSAVLRCVGELRGRVYDTLLARRTAARDADLLTRVVSDVDATQDAVLRCAIPMAVGLTVTLTAGVAAAFADPLVAAVVLAGLVLTCVVLPAGSLALARRTAAATAPGRARLAEQTADLVHGAAELTVFGAVPDRLRDADTTVRRLARSQRGTAAVTAVLGAGAVVVQAVTCLAVIMLGIARDLPGPVVAAIALGALAAIETTIPLAGAAARWAEVSTSVRRLGELLTGPSAEPSTVEGVRLEVPPGARIGVVGPTGSGKSTLLDGLARERVACGVLADAHLFHTSVRHNIAMAKPGATQQDLDRVAALVRLDEWIASLPDGWDTVLGESGATVSGGQRQRLLLARALLAAPAVLLLDEPVEGLDHAMADAVLADVLAASDTVVLVTHRLAPLAHGFDEIVVLDGGRIAQHGTHEELLARDGYYRQAWLAERMLESGCGTNDPSRTLSA